MPLSVLKLGGSLFSLPDIVSRVRNLIRDHSIPQPVIVPGGGESADLVRVWSRRFLLGGEASHWLAVDAMSLNARLLRASDAGVQLVTTRQEVRQAAGNGRLAVFDPAAGLRLQETLAVEERDVRLQPVLPRSWDVTSDSIAAWLAVGWNADQLWLLKSVAANGSDLTDLAARGAVDPYFATSAASLKNVFWVDLRSNTSPVPVRVSGDSE
ncbi:MAG: hypothetical protein R3C19_23420 [Planctomycetaceae bacterium]